MLDATASKPQSRATGGEVRPLAGSGLKVVRGGRILLEVADIVFGDGRLTAIVGPNGAGKTLLLKVLAGIMPADEGVVTWGGAKPDRQGYKKLSLVLQAPVLLRRTALANITYALRAAGRNRDEAAELASRSLARAGLAHLAGSPARLLSGGEKQRLALARALAIDPEILLLDEPVANLDPASALAIEAMVDDARSRGTTVVLVTHDLAQARRLSDDIIFMHRGKFVERSASDKFFIKPETELAAAFVNGEIVV